MAVGALALDLRALQAEQLEDRRARRAAIASAAAGDQRRAGEREREAAQAPAARATEAAGAPAARAPDAPGAAASRAATAAAMSGVAGHSTCSAAQPRLEVRHSRPPLRARRAAAPARARRARLDGPARNAERGRGLLLAEVEQVAAGRAQAVVLAQPGERARTARRASRRRGAPPRARGPPRPRGAPRRRRAAPGARGGPPERRRLRASLATIVSSHGRSGSPLAEASQRAVRLTKASCAASSASAALPVIRTAVRNAISWWPRTSCA